MSLQEYIDQFHRTLEKHQDFGLSEFFDFKQEIRFKEHKHLENGTIIHASVPEPVNLIDEILELF